MITFARKELFMQVPVQIVMKGAEVSDAVYDKVNSHVARLEKHYPQLVSCLVVVERSLVRGKTKLEKTLYNVRIEIQIPGDFIVVERRPIMQKNLENMYLTIKIAFDAMERRLREAFDRKRKNIKIHEDSHNYGIVTKILPYEQCGFLMTPDGREIYFHENSVLDQKYNRMTVGSRVRFNEEEGDEGPQASTVTLVESSRRSASDRLSLAG
jgi:ribosomal subunit interface protein